MWEYKLLYIKYRLFDELIKELNKYGEDNWEVIHYQEKTPKEYSSENEVKVLLKREKVIQHDNN